MNATVTLLQKKVVSALLSGLALGVFTYTLSPYWLLAGGEKAGAHRLELALAVGLVTSTLFWLWRAEPPAFAVSKDGVGMDPRRVEVISELRLRSFRLRRQASLMFVLVVASIVAGLGIFVFAGTIGHEAPSPAQSGFDVNVMLTRLTIALLLLFLVRILLQAYRHNLALAGFYDSRADALQLTKDPTQLPDAASFELFSPGDLSFGAIPKTPIQDLVAMGDVIGQYAAALHRITRKAKRIRLARTAPVEQHQPSGVAPPPASPTTENPSR